MIIILTNNFKGMPPFVSSEVNQMMNSNPKSLLSLSILEIGCGNGHALLELQSAVPIITTFCVNKKGIFVAAIVIVFDDDVIVIVFYSYHCNNF